MLTLEQQLLTTSLRLHLLLKDELHPHLQRVTQLSCEVVFLVLVLQLSQLLLPVEGHAADVKVVRPRQHHPLLAQVQVADALPLVDFEKALLVAVVDVVAHVVAERGQGRGELQDVVTVTEAADVQVHLEGVFSVHAGQAHHLRQLQETQQKAANIK